ncbi:FecCD family ABC transporter permease [Gynuella sunshinyii]|uniref:ABC-type Fe3+-siderophore transport system, permease component n=1 Tax=Gynuella sunshinyii YC6258 TaxID=1445510 RepID=A0A0C5VJR6_9GAMM|nr:iron ABC transporter permease [Gynuella sunshinyii]AJQ94907.1 ABC-type Fe3+-siderophore transport system, permease component [Gynuella sunshinyii YC6258]
MSKQVVWLTGLLAILLITCMASMLLGPVKLGWPMLLQWLTDTDSVPKYASLVFGDVRLTRMLMAILVGAALAMSGAAIQGVFRNPLADPGLIGVSSGAALTAVAVIVLGNGIAQPLIAPLGAMALPIAAFLGGLLVTWFIYLIASASPGNSNTTMILAGIAVSSLCMAATGAMTYAADDSELRTLTFWTLGSFGGTNWQTIKIAAPWIIIGIVLLPLMGRWLNVLLMGENVAGHLGIPISRIRKLIFLLVALCVGASVSVTGMIGFFGLVVPHLIRLSIGPDHRWLLPVSGVAGAVLMLLADLLARTVVAPAELPVGVVTSLLGGPFFLWLIIRFNRGDFRVD